MVGDSEQTVHCPLKLLDLAKRIPMSFKWYVALNHTFLLGFYGWFRPSICKEDANLTGEGAAVCNLLIPTGLCAFKLAIRFWLNIAKPVKLTHSCDNKSMSELRLIFYLLPVLAVIIYLLAMAWIFFFQERLIYVPSRTLWRTPADAGLDFEDVWLTAADGIRLHSWFLRTNEASGTVLFFHGNAGNISHRIETAEMFLQWGLNVLLIDYRGYGQSEGKPTEAGTRADAYAAWMFLVEQRKVRSDQIIIHGRSLGSAIAADLAARVKPAGVILESGFSTLAAVGATLYPWLPVHLLSRHHYRTIENVTRFRSPVLVAHSRDDELIPFSHGQAVFAAAPEPKTFFVMSGSHASCVTVTGTRYETEIRNFIEKAFRLSSASQA